MGRRVELTNSQISNMRANQMRRCSKILTRVAKFANGELENGEPVNMTAAQLRAAALIKDTCLPAMQASTIEDVTPAYVDSNPVELQAQYMDMIKDTLAQLPEDERRQLLLETDSH